MDLNAKKPFHFLFIKRVLPLFPLSSSLLSLHYPSSLSEDEKGLK
jgi:hypothetical protein